jgi:hypothetical protein
VCWRAVPQAQERPKSIVTLLRARVVPIVDEDFLKDQVRMPVVVDGGCFQQLTTPWGQFQLGAMTKSNKWKAALRPGLYKESAADVHPHCFGVEADAEGGRTYVLQVCGGDRCMEGREGAASLTGVQSALQAANDADRDAWVAAVQAAISGASTD